jgi:hypothetical protein
MAEKIKNVTERKNNESTKEKNKEITKERETEKRKEDERVAAFRAINSLRLFPARNSLPSHRSSSKLRLPPLLSPLAGSFSCRKQRTAIVFLLFD